MASIFRDAVTMVFVDADNRELARVLRPDLVPRAGENVRLRSAPHLVERVGYDYIDGALTQIWVVCRPA